MPFWKRLSTGILFGLLGNEVLTPAAFAQTDECSSANITLTTQAQVDAFQDTYGNGGICSVVTGTIFIEGSGITNLDGLGEITSVYDLIIKRNNALTNLDGLGGMKQIIFSLIVEGNDALTNLDGLGELTFAFDLIIKRNNALTNLDGLGGITSVGAFLLKETTH